MADIRKTGKILFGKGEAFERELEIYEPDDAAVFALLRAGDMLHEDNDASRRLLALQVFGDAVEGLLVDEESVGFLYRGITSRRIPLTAYADLAVQMVEYWGKGNKVTEEKPGARRKPAARR